MKKISMGKNTLSVFLGSLMVLSAFTSIPKIVLAKIPLTGALTNASVVPASLHSEAIGNVAVQFTTTTDLPIDGAVRVVFPAGFDVSKVTGNNCTLGGGFTVTPFDALVTITRNGGTGPIPGGTTITCQLGNIKNPGPGTTGVFDIATTDNADNILDENANVPGVTIVTGNLTNASVVPASLQANTTNNVTVQFTTAADLPIDGKVKVNFPTGFNVSNVTGNNCTLDGGFTVTPSSQLVTISRNGIEPIAAGTTITCQLRNIKNPGPGTTGVFDISTTDNANIVLDENANVPGVTIVAPTPNPSPNPTPQPPPTPTPPPPTPNPAPKPTNCDGFVDISNTDPNCNVYTWVKSAGIFTGNPDGTFNPAGLLQRDQIAKVVLEAFKKYHAGTEYCLAGNPFPDVLFGEWAREYICLGKSTLVNGQYLLTGYKSGPNAGLFLPGNAVNRSEFLAMVLRNLNETMPSANTPSFSDVPLNQWDSSYAAYAAENLSSIYPQPTLNRTQLVNRLEAARVLFALHNQGKL